MQFKWLNQYLYHVQAKPWEPNPELGLWKPADLASELMEATVIRCPTIPPVNDPKPTFDFAGEPTIIDGWQAAVTWLVRHIPDKPAVYDPAIQVGMTLLIKAYSRDINEVYMMPVNKQKLMESGEYLLSLNGVLGVIEYADSSVPDATASSSSGVDAD